MSEKWSCSEFISEGRHNRMDWTYMVRKKMSRTTLMFLSRTTGKTESLLTDVVNTVIEACFLCVFR